MVNLLLKARFWFLRFLNFSSYNETGNELIWAFRLLEDCGFLLYVTVFVFLFAVCVFLIVISFYIHNRTFMYKLQKKFLFLMTHSTYIASPQTLKFYEGGICGSIFLHVNFFGRITTGPVRNIFPSSITYCSFLVRYLK